MNEDQTVITDQPVVNIQMPVLEPVVPKTENSTTISPSSPQNVDNSEAIKTPSVSEVEEQTNNRQREPVSTSWKPGQSGNPHGRPKKEWTWSMLLEEAAEELVETKGKDGQITGRKALKQLIARKLLTMAAGGNVQAARELMNRMEGMPKQPIEATGEINLNVNDMLKKVYGDIGPDSTE